MNSRAVPRFWKLYRALPEEVRRLAAKQFQRWREDPNHPSLHFKRVLEREDIWSVRISRGHRALALREVEVFYWFWIGSHGEYERIIAGE